MASPISRETRLRSALSALRDQLDLKPLNAAERAKLWAGLKASKWFDRNFYLIRYANPSWKGDMLNSLHELSYYAVPREKWATCRQKRESWVRREQTYALLALVRHKLGEDAAKRLRLEYVANGVKHRPKRVLTPGQKARLAASARKRFGKQKAVSSGLVQAIGERIAIIRGAAPKRLAKGATVPGRRRITLED